MYKGVGSGDKDDMPERERRVLVISPENSKFNFHRLKKIDKCQIFW